MNSNSSFLYSSTEDHGVPPKRQKMNSLNSSSISPSNNETPAERHSRDRTRALAALRRRILQAGAIAVQFQNMKLQIEEIIREEEESLEVNMNLDRDLMRQLEIALAPSMCSPEEDSEAQASAQVEMAQIKARISSKIVNSRTENFIMDHSSRDGTPMMSKAQKNGTRAQKLLNPSAKKVKVGSSQVLEEQRVHQVFNRDRLEEPKPIIPKFHSETVAHVHRLGQKRQSSEDVLLTLRETGGDMNDLVVTDHMLSGQNGLEDVENVEQLMMFLPERSDGLSSSLQCYGSMDSGTWSASVANETSYPPLFPNFAMQDGAAGTVHPDSLWVPPEASLHPTNHEDYTAEVLDLSLPSFNNVDEVYVAEPSGLGLKVWLGNHYVIVSRQFFLIDWESHYTRRSNVGYACNYCPTVRNGRVRIQDHIWSAHYDGRFYCPLCPGRRSLKSRQGVRDHKRRSHFA